MINQLDKAILEAAAKAAHYDFWWMGDDTLIVVSDRNSMGTPSRYGPWNPLESKADAFDLLTRCGLTVDFLNGIVYYPNGRLAAVGSLDIKRTITRAAAEDQPSRRC